MEPLRHEPAAGACLSGAGGSLMSGYRLLAARADTHLIRRSVIGDLVSDTHLIQRSVIDDPMSGHRLLAAGADTHLIWRSVIGYLVSGH